MNNVDLVIKYIEEQNLQQAEKYLKKVMAAGTDEEKFILAENLSNYGYFEHAIELYEILLSVYPDESEIKLRLVELLIELNRDEEAYEYLESISPSDPMYPAALLVEADLYEMQGLFEVSENKLHKAKELLPDEPVIDYALGELYMTQGRFLEATRCFQLLLDMDQNKIAAVDIYGRMAEALSAGGAFEDALPYYEQAIQNKKDINTMFGYGLTSYQAGQYKKAIQAFSQLQEMDPDYQSLYLYLAKCYEHEEQLNEALAAVKKGLALDVFNKDLFMYAGKLSLKLGDEEKAEQFFKDALALDPEFSDAALTLNKLLLHKNRYEDVVKISEAFIHEGGTDPQFHWDLAVSYQQLENFQEALKHYEIAYNEFNNNRDFLADYGYFLLEEGRREDATRMFRFLAEIEPDNDEWLSILEGLEAN